MFPLWGTSDGSEGFLHSEDLTVTDASEEVAYTVSLPLKVQCL